MPGFDGTGPRGTGPMSGRGMGVCGFLNSNRGRTAWIGSTALAICGMIVRDAANPDGITRKMLRTAHAAMVSKHELIHRKHLKSTTYKEV